MRHHLLTTGLIAAGIASIAATAAHAQTVPSQPPTATGLANGAPPPAATAPVPTPTPAPTPQPAPAAQTTTAAPAQGSGQTGYSEQKSVSPPWNAPYQKTRIHPVVKAQEVHDMTPSRDVEGQSPSTYNQSATNPATPRTRVVVSGRTY